MDFKLNLVIFVRFSHLFSCEECTGVYVLCVYVSVRDTKKKEKKKKRS